MRHMRDLTMTYNRHRPSDTDAAPRAPLDAAERALLKDAERIAAEVAEMTPAEVADYLVEHDLQELVAPARVDALLIRARERVLRRHQAEGPPSAAPLAVAAVLDGLRRTVGENVVYFDPKAHETSGDASRR